MKSITEKWLIEKQACSEAIEDFTANWPKRIDNVKAIERLIKENKLEWGNWLIVRLMSYKQYVSYAVFAAEQVIDNFEKQYPDDKRPRQAIEAAKKCIKNPSKENKSAARAAYSAARAAYSAASAAYSADSAAYSAMRIKILRYGIQLLKGGK